MKEDGGLIRRALENNTHDPLDLHGIRLPHQRPQHVAPFCSKMDEDHH